MTRVLLIVAAGLLLWLALAVLCAVVLCRAIRLAEQPSRPTLRLVPPLDEDRRAS